MARKTPTKEVKALVAQLKDLDEAKRAYVFGDVRELIPAAPDVAKAVPVPWSTVARGLPVGAGLPAELVAERTSEERRRRSEQLQEDRAARAMASGIQGGAETTSPGTTPLASGDAVEYAGMKGRVSELRGNGDVAIVD